MTVKPRPALSIRAEKLVELDGETMAHDIPVQVASEALPKPKVPRASTRIGKRGAVVWLQPEAIKQLGMMAIEEDSSVQALMSEAVNALFISRGKHRYD